MIIISITLLLIIIEIFLHYENYYHPYKRFEYKINNINYNFNDDPKKYFNEQVMMALELAAKKEFLYGEMDQDIPEDIQ